MIRLLVNRRSIRKYKTQKVECEKVDKLLTAALLAPSSRGRKPWGFLVVDDEDILKQLSQAKEHGSQFISKVPQVIVVFGDTMVSDMCVEDCSIAATYIQLEAERLGLGSCWVQIRERLTKKGTSSEGYVKALLSIPDHFMVEAIIAIGYPDEEKIPHNLDELDVHKVHYNKYKIMYPGHY
ncbi:NAD(P)H-dependent dehydrogenase/reductase [Petrocella atlantisensis]|uniref:NAD(P)H-dependent dehydrogenase/reductase n=1 Tax=Petrocella atlantisensis TaxID=2173034 RepID=A0A3P7Q037_9FIRM|nr:nitroreductase family protein [Petrocella atlantisensis]PKM56184.1 MAG: NAD(P)H-dependent dehydrogenase/reductase [Firmicutes bacterium HGW-Firmicutes-5]VDN48771.1 NAD(P)H-dependent dehydrogenase/reductase [Petrocella atlantisensis]